MANSQKSSCQKFITFYILSLLANGLADFLRTHHGCSGKDELGGEGAGRGWGRGRVEGAGFSTVPAPTTLVPLTIRPISI